ncbi:1957_t:CDS:2, partial [Racocetra persica]
MDSRPLPPGWVSQYDHNYKRYYFVDTTKQPPVSTWDDPRDASQPQSSTQSQGLYPPPQNNQYNSPSFPQPQPYLSPQSYPQRPHSYHGESQSSQSGAPKKKKKNIWNKLGFGKFGSSSSNNPNNPGNIGPAANYGNSGSGKKHNFSSMALGGLGGA